MYPELKSSFLICVDPQLYRCSLLKIVYTDNIGYFLIKLVYTDKNGQVYCSGIHITKVQTSISRRSQHEPSAKIYGISQETQEQKESIGTRRSFCIAMDSYKRLPYSKSLYFLLVIFAVSGISWHSRKLGYKRAGVGTFAGHLRGDRPIQYRPEDVFLFFTKTPKTSGTVVSSLISAAYESAGLPTVWKETDSGTHGLHTAKFASVLHRPGTTPETLRNVEREVRRPVLLVLSI